MATRPLCRECGVCWHHCELQQILMRAVNNAFAIWSRLLTQHTARNVHVNPYLIRVVRSRESLGDLSLLILA